MRPSSREASKHTQTRFTAPTSHSGLVTAPALRHILSPLRPPPPLENRPAKDKDTLQAPGMCHLNLNPAEPESLPVSEQPSPRPSALPPVSQPTFHRQAPGCPPARLSPPRSTTVPILLTFSTSCRGCGGSMHVRSLSNKSMIADVPMCFMMRSTKSRFFFKKSTI